MDGAAGACVAGKAIRPELEVIGVQSSAAPAAYRSWQARELLEDRMERARELGLDPDYVKALYDVIHAESVRRQSAIVSNGRVGALEDAEVERWSTPPAS